MKRHIKTMQTKLRNVCINTIRSYHPMTDLSFFGFRRVRYWRFKRNRLGVVERVSRNFVSWHKYLLFLFTRHRKAKRNVKLFRY